MDDAMPRKLLVEARRQAAEDVVVLELVDPAGGELPPWEPGAHLELLLPSGLLRQYSLCNPQTDRSRYAVAVLRVGDGRGGSIELHDGDLVGQLLEVRGPRNNFPLVEAAGYLLFAGGIGVTPLLAMARKLEDEGRDWSMVYGGRSRSRMAFLEELESLGAERLAVVPQDTTGIPDFASAIVSAKPGTAIYCCGPEAMLAAIEALHERIGGHTELHIERFSASAELRDLAASPSHGFQVVLKRSGHVLDVPPDGSLLEAVRAVVPSVEFSCSEGICGSCEISVLEGEVDHRDGLLTEEERQSNTTMMICVSRARADRLVLDL